ncbi:MAG: hypothetical protein MJE77_47790 [Proteobacteria bacterium]|nr:hypothetical protein [Pseudomonadota bacterium]
MRKPITCPESAHLEEIEFCEDPLSGRILGVKSCTVFSPPESVDCEIVCAALLNRRLETELARTTQTGQIVVQRPSLSTVAPASRPDPDEDSE